MDRSQNSRSVKHLAMATAHGPPPLGSEPLSAILHASLNEKTPSVAPVDRPARPLSRRPAFAAAVVVIIVIVANRFSCIRKGAALCSRRLSISHGCQVPDGTGCEICGTPNNSSAAPAPAALRCLGGEMPACLWFCHSCVTQLLVNYMQNYTEHARIRRPLSVHAVSVQSKTGYHTYISLFSASPGLSAAVCY